MQSLTSFYLKKRGLRDTQPRRMVLFALETMDGSHSPQDICDWIGMKGDTTHIVTVYRILASLEKARLVHKHPCDGKYSLCTIPDAKGHHGLMHCTRCGLTEEFCDEKFCAMEERVAATADFRPESHMSEIMGTCHSCR